ncbi:hypothetical protein [Halomonas sp. H10-9-1]|uniref:hypothetical protein n=1 Tax=Halomonas sp. H10-9-1 TaxID=2950871 RepID=UPI0032DE3192
MTDPQLNRDMPRRRQWRRLTNLAAIAALGLGSLALAGCGDGEEALPPTEEPAGEESTTRGEETSMGQGSSMDSEAPVMQQGRVMDPESSGSQENDDQSGN